MNCKMTIYFGEILFWVSMSIYINHFHLGGWGEEGMCVRFLDFGVPNMFPNMFPIVTIRITHFIVRLGSLTK
jgi:hypothetical protein